MPIVYKKIFKEFLLISLNNFFIDYNDIILILILKLDGLNN